MNARFTTLLGVIFSVLSHATSAQGGVFLTMDEALKLAFPQAETQRSTAYLSKPEVEAIAKRSGQQFTDAVIRPYIAQSDGNVVGTAYFDNHRVRSRREILMVVVQPDGTVGRIELLAFGEPKEYIPKSKWYRQFDDQALTKELRLKRSIRPMTGATLTARATINCVRRTLAIHSVLMERESKTPADEKGQVKPASRPSTSTQPASRSTVKQPASTSKPVRKGNT